MNNKCSYVSKLMHLMLQKVTVDFTSSYDTEQSNKENLCCVIFILSEYNHCTMMQTTKEKLFIGSKRSVKFLNRCSRVFFKCGKSYHRCSTCTAPFYAHGFIYYMNVTNDFILLLIS